LRIVRDPAAELGRSKSWEGARNEARRLILEWEWRVIGLFEFIGTGIRSNLNFTSACSK
jgi:hypothetical protein